MNGVIQVLWISSPEGHGATNEVISPPCGLPGKYQHYSKMKIFFKLEQTKPLVSSCVEDPNHDSYRRGKAEDPGGAVGQPRCSFGNSRAVPPQPGLYQCPDRSTAALGLQTQL